MLRTVSFCTTATTEQVWTDERRPNAIAVNGKTERGRVATPDKTPDSAGGERDDSNAGSSPTERERERDNVLELGGVSVLRRVPRGDGGDSPKTPPSGLVCAFYAAMEFLQAAQWIELALDSDSDTAGWKERAPSERLPCEGRPAANVALTVVAYLLIYAQPVLYAAIGSRFVSTERFAHPLMLAVAGLVIAAWNIFTHDSPASVRGKNASPFTCTVIGPNGHLRWGFATRSQDFQPK